MTRVSMMAAALLVGTSAAALAQTDRRGWNEPPRGRDPFADMQRQQQEDAARERAAQRPTKFELMDQSLDALLSDAWVITSATMDNLILAKRSKWAWCNVHVTNGFMGSMAGSQQPWSKCWALN